MKIVKTLKEMAKQHDDTEMHLNALDHVERGGAVKVPKTSKSSKK